MSGCMHCWDENPSEIEEISEEQFNAKNETFMARLQAAENKAEVIVGKQRHGPTGSINVHFEKRFTYFSDLTETSTLPEGY